MRCGWWRMRSSAADRKRADYLKAMAATKIDLVLGHYEFDANAA